MQVGVHTVQDKSQRQASQRQTYPARGTRLAGGRGPNWKRRPRTAPRYMPVQRAHRGIARSPRWNDRRSIRWQTA